MPVIIERTGPSATAPSPTVRPQHGEFVAAIGGACCARTPEGSVRSPPLPAWLYAHNTLVLHEATGHLA
jgi:hypothetical protein